MFITRTISGAILLVIIFGTLIPGGPVWLAVTCALSMIALYEMLKTLQLHKSHMAVCSYAAAAILYLLYGFSYYSFEMIAMIVLVLYFMSIMAAYVIKWPKYQVSDITRAFFSYFYSAFLISFLYQIRMLDCGIYYMWLVFISAWGSDTCAYLVGILIGKHKVPSTLSPKKTIEGCVGGIVGAGIIGFIYGIILSDAGLGGVFAGICMAGSVISQIGDLAASAVKRNMGIKDYGKLIPGHGGVMDRFDSIIFVAPVIYCIIYILTVIGVNISFV